jgi:amino acid adenylation domain-containing protein
MVVGLLAILKTGAAYVPLDSLHPAERLALIVEDAGVGTLLTQRGLSPQLEDQCELVVYFDDRPRKISNRCSRQRADTLAYVIYTSGSTGRPNGVAVPHRAVVNLLNSMRHKPGLNEGDRLLAVTTIAFDIAVLEIFLPLMVGATVVIAPAKTAANGPELLDAIRWGSITAMQATPATWRLLLAAGWSLESAHLKVLCGGEALPVDLASQLVARSDSVWNLYGPTETTIWSACCRLSKENAAPIGKPIGNTQLHVLDRHLQRVPIGIPGELFIGGAGVTKGYWNRSELTTQRFLPDPFARDQSSELFRTGDEVCLKASGEIEFLRRLDSQVKIRGFRIELGEVEAALARCEGVFGGAVVVREDTPGEHRLVGYVVARAGRLQPPNIQAALRRTLAEYMIPVIVVVDRLPLTENGKVDRSRLLSAEFTPLNSYEILPPRDEPERTLATIWEELLGVHPIGIRDSFFDLGGHSLLAAKLFARIEEKFTASLPLATLFHEPTIEHLADQLRHHHAVTSSCLETLHSAGTRPPLFMGGSNPRYLEVSRWLGPDQPVYKMDLYAAAERRIAAGHQPYTNLEQYAAEFVREIRAVQPRGPYFLGGGCDGGVLSLEIARQIQASGEQVGLLVLWETPRKGFFERDWCGTALHIVLKFVQALARGDFKAPTTPARTHALMTAEQTRHLYIHNSCWEAIRRYTLPKFLGSVTIIRAQKQHRFYKDVVFGWNRIATQGIEVHRVPGDHSSYFTEFFSEFTAVLAAILERAQTTQAHIQSASLASLR